MKILIKAIVLSVSVFTVGGSGGVGAHESKPLEEADFVKRAQSSQKLQAIKERLTSEEKGLTLDTSRASTIVDDLFGDGDLLGVYFPVVGAQEGSFVSLWYDRTTGAVTHTVLGLNTRVGDEVAVSIEVDGRREVLGMFPADSNFDSEVVVKSAGQETCLRACRGGAASRQAFCRTIPHPAIRAACWGVVFASYAGCAGFCYWYY